MYQTTVKEFLKDEAGNLTGAVISCLKPERDPETGRTSMVPTGKEFTYDCQLAFIAAGFTGCENYTADAFGVELTARGNVADHSFKTNVDKVFVCGDMRRGQSLGGVGPARGPRLRRRGRPLPHGLHEPLSHQPYHPLFLS